MYFRTLAHTEIFLTALNKALSMSGEGLVYMTVGLQTKHPRAGLIAVDGYTYDFLPPYVYSESYDNQVILQWCQPNKFICAISIATTVLHGSVHVMFYLLDLVQSYSYT